MSDMIFLSDLFLPYPLKLKSAIVQGLPRDGTIQVLS